MITKIFFYQTTIITKNKKDNENARNEVKLQIEVKNSRLFIKCYFYKNYFI